MRSLIIYILMLGSFATTLQSQNNKHLNELNTVWQQFYEAFEKLDYSIMTKIHSTDVIRISGGKNISDYGTYMANNKASFEYLKANKMTNTIELRFFERIANDSVASERGIYKLSQIRDKTNTQDYYGKFHVIMEKQNGQWFITMDYDSNENGQIGEAEFMKAYAIDDFENF